MRLMLTLLHAFMIHLKFGEKEVTKMKCGMWEKSWFSLCC